MDRCNHCRTPPSGSHPLNPPISESQQHLLLGPLYDVGTSRLEGLGELVPASLKQEITLNCYDVVLTPKTERRLASPRVSTSDQCHHSRHFVNCRAGSRGANAADAAIYQIISLLFCSLGMPQLKSFQRAGPKVVIDWNTCSETIRKAQVGACRTALVVILSLGQVLPCGDICDDKCLSRVSMCQSPQVLRCDFQLMSALQQPDGNVSERWSMEAMGPLEVRGCSRASSNAAALRWRLGDLQSCTSNSTN